VSNNVGIDFTELGGPHGIPQKPVSKDQGNEKQDELITIGFRVKPREKAIIQDYCYRMYNQFVVDRVGKDNYYYCVLGLLSVSC
jgi:hypothetical protein